MANNLTDIGDMERKYINSYVILDLETTGLPRLNFNKSKPTEIAFVSVLREHILDKFNENKTSGSANINYIPRTTNKLLECINPQRSISEDSSNNTGLYNEMLEVFHPFDETLFNIMMGCFDRLVKPICIIAHNGLKHDFRILQAQIQKINKKFPDDIMCADSYPAFLELLPSFSLKNLNDIQPLNEKKEGTKYDITSEWDDDDDNDEPYGNGSLQRQINESTPSRSTGISLTHISRKRRASYDNTPPSTPIKSKTTETEVNAKRKILSKKTLNSEPNIKASYRLIDIYQYLTKRPLHSPHRAENDALALLQCITVVGPTFLNWVDVNSKPFKSVEKL